MEFAEVLFGLESKLLDCSARKDAEWVGSVLTDDFREFGSSGRIFTKSQIIAELQGERTVRLTIEDFEARLLGDGVVLVTYRTTRGGEGGASEAASCSLRSSIWVLRGGRWQMLFHQGTRAL